MHALYGYGCGSCLNHMPSMSHGLARFRWQSVADDVILRPEPRLAANFGPSRLSAGRISERYWQCTLAQEILTVGPYVDVATGLARQLLKEPGYDIEDRALIFLFGREAVTVPGTMIDEVLSSPEWFQYWLNAGWVQVGYDSFPYEIGHYSAVVSPDLDRTRPETHFVPVDTSTEDKTHLLSAVKLWGYMLYHHGIGIAARGKPIVMLTSGTGRWVEHPRFGQLPSGASYIDLRSWQGDDRIFSESDLVRV